MLLKELVMMPVNIESDKLNIIQYDGLMDCIRGEVKRLQSFESVVYRGRKQ